MDRASFEAAHDLARRPRQVSPINVECLDDDELDACIEHPAVHTEVKRCAELTRFARAERLAGRIEAAQRAETKVDRVYNMLPKGLRW